jgi:hypothetical protein
MSSQVANSKSESERQQEVVRRLMDEDAASLFSSALREVKGKCLRWDEFIASVRAFLRKFQAENDSTSFVHQEAVRISRVLDDYSSTGTPVSTFIRLVIDNIWNLDSKGIFRYAVSELVAPGYSSEVETPMCLADMYEKLRCGMYNDNLEGLESDIKLMLENCFAYNDRETTPYKAAETIKKHCYKKLLSPRHSHEVLPVPSIAFAYQPKRDMQQVYCPRVSTVHPARVCAPRKSLRRDSRNQHNNSSKFRCSELPDDNTPTHKARQCEDQASTDETLAGEALTRRYQDSIKLLRRLRSCIDEVDVTQLSAEAEIQALKSEVDRVRSI